MVAAAAGCADPEVTLAPPEGYEAAEWRVRHEVEGARAGVDAVDAGAPIRDPWNILVAPPGPLAVGSAVFVAERRGWRVLRFEVEGVDPVRLGSPSVAVSTEPWRRGAAWMPADVGVERRDDRFGMVLARSADGVMLLSGPSGQPWVVEPGQAEARRLGAGPLGLEAVEGAAIGRVDLSALAGAAFDEGGDGRPPAVLLAANGAIFSLDPAGLRDPQVPLRRVLGSGARAQADTGALALSAPLELFFKAPLAVDDSGNLFVLEVDAGRVLMVPGYAQQGARVVRLAGVGRGALVEDEASPLNQRFDLGLGNSLTVTRQGAARHLDFLNFGGIPWRVTVEVEGDEARIIKSDFLVGRTLPSMQGGFTVAGDRVLAGRGDFGSLSAFQFGEEGVEEHLAGHAGRDFEAIDADFLPTLLRPGALLTTKVHGTPTLVLSDQSSSHIALEFSKGEAEAVVFRQAGTAYDPYRNLSIIPAAQGQAARLLIGSQQEVLSYSIEGVGRRPPVLYRADEGALSLSGMPAGAFSAARAPVAFGARAVDDAPLFFDASRGVIFALPGSAALDAGSELTRLAGGEFSRVTPLGATAGSLVLDLSGARQVAVGPLGFITAVIEDAARGDLALVMRTDPAPEAAALAGRALPRVDQGIVAAGGGAGRPLDGALATEVGFKGLVSAVAGQQGELWMSLRGAGGTTELARVDAQGRLDRLSAPGSPPLDGFGRGPVSLSALVVSGEASLGWAPCLPPGVLLLMGQQGAWWLNTGSAPSPGPEGAPLAAGEAARAGQRAARQVICLDGDPWLLDLDGAGVESTVTGQRVTLGRAASSITVTAAGRALVVAADQGALLGVNLPGEGGAQEGRGLVERLEGGDLAPLSGQTPTALDGRRLFKVGLADELPIFASADEGGLYGAMAGALFEVLPLDGVGFDPNGHMRVLWEGAPLDGVRPTALAVEPGAGPVRLLVAASDRLYRFTLDPSIPPGPDKVRRGRFERLAGGGVAFPGLGESALSASVPGIEGIVPVGDRIWLRWSGYVGSIGPDGILRAIAGGGHRGLEATDPWDLSLSPRVGAHPALALAPDGRLVTPEPRLGAIIDFSTTTIR